ncbi:MAG: lipopolysaccharide biosynthesis protein RfbH [Verrucomicrobia bacterium]|nr:lipopolysaccharide biosynthesis protein RfbH [Verrucomicrobiota bacterium]
MHKANRPAADLVQVTSASSNASTSVQVVSSSSGGADTGTGTSNLNCPRTGTGDLNSSGWRPGQTIPYAGRVFDQDEVEAAVGATLDFWLTLGPEGEAFEKELAALLGVKHSLLVNSGSSANLVAFAALTTHKLPPHKRIQPGDEVITVAAGFPTTVAPIIQSGAVAVFLDNNPVTGNIRPEQLESAFVAGKTKAVMIAHALGNPFDLGAVLEFCRKRDLWLIEDNCDALGCTYSLPVEKAKSLGLDHLLKLAEANSVQVTSSGSSFEPCTGTGDLNFKIPFVKNGILTAYTGTFGDISTQSFYPPHHLTMGEGGAVNIISKPPLKTYAESFRDWGRDCWCASGKDDTCGKRFGWQLGELPKGYDHKYIYSHLGYNLKPLDPQAAIGRQQLKKLPAFIEARKQNWETLRTGLADLEEFFDFTLPTHAVRWLNPSERHGVQVSSSSSGSEDPCTGTGNLNFASCFEWDSTGCRTDTSWFGFMLRVKPTAPFSHTDFARHLDEKKIGNRMFFGGNLLRQPVFVQLRKDRPDAIRVVTADGRALTSSELELEMKSSNANLNSGLELKASPLPGADAIMNEAIFLGTYPGLTAEMLAYEIQVIRDFVKIKGGQ